MNSELKAKVLDLPRSPGVYLFKDDRDKVLYVGKAKALKNRVSSYFQKNLKLGTKTHALVSRIVDMDTIKTASEIEALVLEAELIKKYRPRYNVALKDDKSYLYIIIRNDTFNIDGKKTKIPKILTARKTDLLPKDITFGPYPSSNDAKTILKIMRKVFPFRDCSVSKFNRYHKSKKPCLYGHIGLCPGPCTAKDVSGYKKGIKNFQKFLSGDGVRLVNSYEKAMAAASKKENYEEAAVQRDILKKLRYVRENYKSAYQYIENPNLLEDIANESLQELVSNIEVLSDKPQRIECYDISNISGKEAVGSMVVALDGLVDNREYRRFKIKIKDQPDDFHMMEEVLERRLKRSKKGYKGKKWPKPDLLVMDGGKGQVSVIADLLEKFELDIPLIGLAKKNETIVYKTEKGFEEVVLPKDNEGLKLLIRLRDEAHRFAQRYHHHLRLKKIRV